MKSFLMTVLIPAFFIFTWGCAAGAWPGSSAALQREVDALKSEVAALKSSQNSGDQYDGAARKYEVQQLPAGVDPYNPEGVNQAQGFEQLNARLDKLEQAGLPNQTSPTNSAEASSGLYNTPASIDSVPLPPENPIFKEAKAQFDKKEYQGAASGFKRYLATEPKGAQADAAQFYIAESFYSRKQYEEAILEYQKVIQGFPKSSQVPTSLLKQGISFQAIGDKESAKLLYQKVIREHPESYAASVSKTRLAGI